MVLLSLSLWLRVLDLDLSLKDPLTDLALDFRLIESRCFRNFKSGSRSSGLVRRLFSSFSEVLGEKGLCLATCSVNNKKRPLYETRASQNLFVTDQTLYF